MGFLDKAKNAAEQAATKAKEGAQELQAKRDLAAAYSDLGKVAFELADKGELTHPQLAETVERIRGLQATIAADDGHVETPPPAAPTGPPAMPT